MNIIVMFVLKNLWCHT